MSECLSKNKYYGKRFACKNFNSFTFKIFHVMIFFVLFFTVCLGQKVCFALESRYTFDYSKGNYNFNLPSSYTSTAQGLVTSVKMQGHSGPCWSFGIVSALESSCLKQAKDNKQNLNKTNVDFSEMNMVYNLNSGASIDNPYEFDFAEAGNNDMVSAYFASGRGPVFEKDDPYVSDYKPRKLDLKKPLAKYIRKIIYIPDPDSDDLLSKENHIKLVKKFIFENGSVASNIFWDREYLDSSGKNYFYKSYSNTSNHTVAIVGWDDNYPKENFSNKRALPQKNGAFIIKNSWGINAHDGGYFYMSYEDQFAGFSAYALADVVEPEDKYKFDNIYQHDYFGMTSALDGKFSEDGDSICSVFDLKTEKELLTDIGLFVASSNVDCKFFLVKVDNDGNLVGYSDFICQKHFDFPGYYVVVLPKKILLADKKFGIGIKMSGDKLLIACETSDIGFSSKAKGDLKCNYFGNKCGFHDLRAYSSQVTNFCIKGFTEKLSAKTSYVQDLNYNNFVLERPVETAQSTQANDVENVESPESSEVEATVEVETGKEKFKVFSSVDFFIIFSVVGTALAAFITLAIHNRFR